MTFSMVVMGCSSTVDPPAAGSNGVDPPTADSLTDEVRRPESAAHPCPARICDTRPHHGWRGSGSETATGLVSGLFAVAVLLWSLSALLGAGGAAIVVRRDPFRPCPPLWEWLGQPDFSGLFLGGCGVTLFAVVIAAAPRRRGRPTAPNMANA
jgi:hypothetical protein